LSALRLRLAPSPRLAALIVLLHSAAAAALLVAVPGLAGASLAVAMLALGLAAAWSRALLRSAASTRVLELAGERVAIELANGARLEAVVSSRRYVSRLLVALPMRAGAQWAGRRILLVTRDMVDADSFRALRIWALWGKTPARAKQPVAGKQLQA
jgi:hypothetical protein